MDLAVFDMKDEKYIGALVMVAIFTKYCCALPEHHLTKRKYYNALKMVLKKMGAKPIIFFHR